MIIGIHGRARSGKDTVANYLVAAHGFVRIAFADPLKAFCREVFGFTEAQLNGDERERPNEHGVVPREALQKLGTEWGRALDPDVWVRIGMRRAKLVGRRVVITDVRFPNECVAIRQADGVLWSVYREGAGLAGAYAAHASESHEFPCDSIITNDGTIDDLFARVDELMEGR
jgi:hypothetical protein